MPSLLMEHQNDLLTRVLPRLNKGNLTLVSTNNFAKNKLGT